MKITRESLEKSLELARNATPGPWFVDHNHISSDYDIICDFISRASDREFTAHHNPEFIKALITSYQNLEKAHIEALKIIGFYADDDNKLDSTAYDDETLWLNDSDIEGKRNKSGGKRAREFLSKHGGAE